MSKFARSCLLKFVLIVFATTTAIAATQIEKPDRDYLLYVVSESADKIALVRFGPDGIRIERQIDTGDMPIDIDGPHGIVISPDRQFYYVSIAHGRPFGSVWKYSTKDDSLVAKTTLGYFPATLDITPDGAFLFVVTPNLLRRVQTSPRPLKWSKTISMSLYGAQYARDPARQPRH